MGSAPCNLFCCTKPSIALPKSDIFVPQINIDIIQNTKNIETNVITNIIDKSSGKMIKPNRQTTEKNIREYRGIRNSLTVGGKNKIKISLTFGSLKDKRKKNSDKNNNKYTLNSSKKEEKRKNSILHKSKTKIINIKQLKKNNKFRDELEQEAPKYEISEHSLTQKEEINIYNIILSHHLFNIKEKEAILLSLKQLKEINIQKDSIIFNEGDIGSCIFFIISGTVEIFSKNSKEKIILNQGSVFGELALYKSNVIRTYTAIAITNLTIYTFDKSFLEKINPDFIQRTPFNFELFNYLSQEDKESIELLINTVEFKKNEIIKNLKGLFLIKEGALSFNDFSGKEKDIYENGEFIGSLKYTYNNNKENIEKIFYSSDILTNNNNIEITAKEDTICHMLPDMALIEVFGLEYKNKIFMSYLKKTFLENKFYKNLFSESDNIKEVINLFYLKEYKNNDMLSSALPDDIKKKIILIIEGQACIYGNSEQEKNILPPGFMVGDEIILGEEQKNTIVESNHLITLECFWDTFKLKINIIKSPLDEWINDLYSIYFFRGLSIFKLIEIAKNIKIEKYKENDKIIKKSDKVEFVYFIHKGTLKLEVDDEIVQEYHEGNSFGEIFIFNGMPSFGEIYVADKKWKSNDNECILYKITKNYFFELLSDPLLNSRTKLKLCLEDIEIFPKNLYYIATLHKGPSSNIYLVHNTIYVYIMKAIYIQTFYQPSAFEGKAVRNVLNEKEASKIIDNPFLVKYVKTLKNQNWCFFVSEYINGILLSEYIRMCKPFNNIVITRFYSACFMIMLEALQNIGIIHRDIKQNNIIIQKNGYPKIIDFLVVKKY